jgi:hypothetical protein
MRIPESAIPHETSISYNLNALHNEKLDGNPARPTAEPVSTEAGANVLSISNVADCASGSEDANDVRADLHLSLRL